MPFPESSGSTLILSALKWLVSCSIAMLSENKICVLSRIYTNGVPAIVERISGRISGTILPSSMKGLIDMSSSLAYGWIGSPNGSKVYA